MKLTKEETIRLHRQMWSDMLEELGEYPSERDRSTFKEAWCVSHKYFDIGSNCFLCEYAEQENLDCDECIIDWSALSEKTTNCYPGFLYSSISDILALPERSD